MKPKQAVLNNYFKRTGDAADFDSDSSDGASVYVPSKGKRMYDVPMAWTRVKEVATAAGKRLNLWDVE